MADLVAPADFAGNPKLAANPALPALIAAASVAVEDHCRREFACGFHTERHPAAGQHRVWLRNPPIIAVASVSYGGVARTGWALADPETGELHLPRDCFQWALDGPGTPGGAHGRVEVTYTGGFEAIPAPVKQATIIVAKHMADSEKATGLFSSESIGDYRYQLAAVGLDDLPPFARKLLRRYRLEQVV